MSELNDTVKEKPNKVGPRCKKFRFTHMVALVSELVKEEKYREACFITLAINTPLSSSQILSLKVKNFCVKEHVSGENSDGKKWCIKLGSDVWELIDGYLSNTDWIADRTDGDTLLFKASRSKDNKQVPLCESSMYVNLNKEVQRKFWLVDNPKFGSLNNTSLKSIYWNRFNKYWEKQQEKNPYVGNITMGLSADAFKK